MSIKPLEDRVIMMDVSGDHGSIGIGHDGFSLVGGDGDGFGAVVGGDGDSGGAAHQHETGV